LKFSGLTIDKGILLGGTEVCTDQISDKKWLDKILYNKIGQINQIELKKS
jgi:hypothetical protein